MNGDVWKTLDWKNSELQGNYNSETDNIKIRHGEYYGAAEPPVRCGESHLSGLTEPPHFVY